MKVARLTRRSLLAGLMSTAFVPMLPPTGYRGIAYIVYEDTPLEHFAQRAAK